jgi:type II secretory ATPase GspE/PulE/Tfp pilus assembly ATPase PilB-like protein
MTDAARRIDLDVPASGEMGIPRIVDTLFLLAQDHRASDIHLEPQVDDFFIRFRIDGVLHTVQTLPKTVMAAVISRIKVLANLDIAEKRLPQDGQIVTTIGKKELDMRVSTLPAKYGEKTVIRLLDKSGAIIDMGHLGMEPTLQSQLEMLIERPQGMFLVTGPTGSGKSTTLYSIIKKLKSPLKNIITLEDPIEYELLGAGSKEAGITQVQIHSKIGLTFAAGLRSALRQDPDVIMLGEIRDQETAEVAMKSAMTGHLVLSTLHTNDAPSAISRLRDMGAEAYLITSTLMGVMAQRLVRVLCMHCRESYEPPMRTLKNLFPEEKLQKAVILYRPKGCPKCQSTGYWGRKGIYELIIVNDLYRELIQSGARTDALKKQAHQEGVRTLRESGMDLVYEGFTSVEEVFRHTVD